MQKGFFERLVRKPSPTLREIAGRGIDVQGAGHAEIAFPFVALGPLVCETLWSLSCGFVYHRHDTDEGDEPLWVFHSITVAARLGLLLLFWQKPRDERCFILKMMSKIQVFYLIICCSVLAVWEAERSKVGSFARWKALPLTVYTSMFGLACVGMKRLASQPFCGTVVLQLFLARGRGCFFVPSFLASEEPYRGPWRMEAESDSYSSPSSTESSESTKSTE